MNKLLLTSALVAVSGVAFADVTLGGRAEIGYNSHSYGVTDSDSAFFPNDEIKSEGLRDRDPSGLFTDVSLDIRGTTELDNGLAVSIDFGGDIIWSRNERSFIDSNGNTVLLDEEDNSLIDWDDFPTITFESPTAKFTVGDVDHAANALFDSINGMYPEFTEVDDELVARLDATLMGQTFAVSYSADDKYSYNGSFDAPNVADAVSDRGAGLPQGSYSIAFLGDYNGFNYSFAYESADFEDTIVTPGAQLTDSNGVGIVDMNGNAVLANQGVADALNGNQVETFGLTGGYNFMGAEFRIGYIKTDVGSASADSVGLEVGYELNGITLNGSVASTNLDNFTTREGDDNFTGYGFEAGFQAMGADIILGWEDDNDQSEDGDGFYADVTYEMEQYGLTFIAGYDESEAVDLRDDDNFGEDGAGYAALMYDLGGGASLIGSYANADEMDRDEIIHGGTTLAVALDF